MNSCDVLVDAFERIRDDVHSAVLDLTPEQLRLRVADRSNSIAWLVWHLARVQDDHVANAAGSDQVWTAGGWVERFGLPFDSGDIGYGHTADEVAAVRVESGELLTGYFDAVHARTAAYVGSLSDADLDRIVDEGWDPPVTLGARLVSVLNDDMQHAGQAALVRGLIAGRATR